MGDVAVLITEEDRVAISVLLLVAEKHPPKPPYDHALVVVRALLARAAEAARAPPE